MKIGVLESRHDPFINDVISRLKGLEVEFLSFREQPVPITSDYKVIVDRMSYRHTYLQEMMKSLALGGTYVINNPFSATVVNKLVDAKICSLLGIPLPKTIVLPDIAIQEEDDDIVPEPDWERVVNDIGLPCMIKPFNGYAWENVYRVDSLNELKHLYDSMRSKHVLLVQELIKYIDYYRVFCINKRDVLFIKWIPKPFGTGEYLYSDLKPLEKIKEALTEMTIKLNSSLDLDLNVVEWCLCESGISLVIDDDNEVPDIDKLQIAEVYYKGIV